MLGNIVPAKKKVCNIDCLIPGDWVISSVNSFIVTRNSSLKKSFGVVTPFKICSKCQQRIEKGSYKIFFNCHTLNASANAVTVDKLVLFSRLEQLLKESQSLPKKC